jgi:[ribosomal protein S18]-alanine N-acetyltransferase
MTTNDNFIVDDVDLGCLDRIVSIADSSGLSYWSINDYRNELQRKESIFRKCSNVPGDINGFVVGRIIPSTSAANLYDAEIYNIAVAEGSRRRGVGCLLMNDFLNECVKKGIKSVWLEVRRSNESAIEFYTRSGFFQISVRRAFYKDPVEDAIVMNRMV